MAEPLLLTALRDSPAEVSLATLPKHFPLVPSILKLNFEFCILGAIFPFAFYLFIFSPSPVLERMISESLC